MSVATATIATEMRYANSEANFGTTSTSAQLSRQWIDRFAELIMLGRNEKNWDGHGAAKADREIVKAAISLFFACERSQSDNPPSACMLSPDGAIVITWHRGEFYIEAELRSPHEAEWMASKGEITKFWTTDLMGSPLPSTEDGNPLARSRF